LHGVVSGIWKELTNTQWRFKPRSHVQTNLKHIRIGNSANIIRDSSWATDLGVQLYGALGSVFTARLFGTAGCDFTAEVHSAFGAHFTASLYKGRGRLQKGSFQIVYRKFFT
jgi:hypothetical protein